MFVPPFLHCHLFYYLGIGTVVTKSLTPSPQDRDIIYGQPQRTSLNYLVIEFDWMIKRILEDDNSVESEANVNFTVLEIFSTNLGNFDNL